MTSRLDDLLATAERQLASHSYDAAVDTYRTALGEPGAAESGVAQLMEAACRVRDEARGIVPAVETAATPEAPPPHIDSEPEPEAARSEPRNEPPPQPMRENRPTEPPTFHLLEPEPFAERREGGPPPLDVENLSILHPTAPPEETESGLVPVARVLIALAIAIGVIVLAHYLK